RPQGAADSGAEGVCALTGVASPLHTGNFPQPNLPGLGQTYVFARNRDIPAMARYGREAAASFPIAAGTAERLAGALQELVSSEREFTTWRMIPAETGKVRDLLIAFNPANLEMPLAEALGGEEPARTEAAFIHMTSVPVQHAGGAGQQFRPEPNVRMLVLRQLDPANRKTIYHREITAQALGEAAHDWKVATANVPDWLTLPALVNKKLTVSKPPFLAPLSLTSVSRRNYTRGRLAGVDVAGIPLTTAYQIFLREGDSQKAARLALRLLLERNTALLLGIADARARGVDALRDLDRTGSLRQDALRALTWIGALLQAIDHHKEVYVTDAAFRLGQLLAAADTVHIGYCIDVRDGQIPPTLLGNSLLNTAGQDPARALSLLLQRWKPYAGWAKRRAYVLARANSYGKNDAFALRRAIYQEREVRETATALHGHIRTLTADKADAFRAELLLGYMAGFPPRNRDAAAEAASDAEEDEDA
ncbi:MAG: hypothetical protein KC442_07150, partial [Thermomicrobiales bacterium]|nr:hypothetical protein [Thermomicrobiales bacterium]